MNALSSSIIVFSGAFLLAVGSHVRHSDTGAFVQVVGCLVGILGFIGWFKACSNDPK